MSSQLLPNTRRRLWRRRTSQISFSSWATTSDGLTSSCLQPAGSWVTKTPNIDRIAREGALFTDWYGQQSCTAGRAAFFTGQSPIRTGLTKVGLPGADLGLGPNDPCVAQSS